MTDEKLVNLMGEARLIAAADNVIFPLIDKKIEEKINYAVGKFANGEDDFIAEIAYIAAMKDIRRELDFKQTQGNKAVKALHDNSKN